MLSRRSFNILSGTVLSGAVTGTAASGALTLFTGPEARADNYGGGSTASQAPTSQVIALLPLSGPYAPYGTALQNAVNLIAPGNGVSIETKDTESNPERAKNLVSQALAQGTKLFLGPLSYEESMAVKPLIAATPGTALLSYSNDPQLSAPDIWPLGITPFQQISRLITAAVNAGHSQFAALLPATAFGNEVAADFARALQNAGLAPPDLAYFEPSSFNSMTESIRILSDYENRYGNNEAKIQAIIGQDNPALTPELLQLENIPIPPPPFDVLFVAASQETLDEIATLLPYFFIFPSQVQIIGPDIWAFEKKDLSRHAAFKNCWYAAPDPAARSTFVNAYEAQYGTTPPVIADLAFDSAALVHLISEGGSLSLPSLLNPQGFTGTDGLFALGQNGQVWRSLAVFSVGENGEASMIGLPPSTVPANFPI